ncbi:MAG: hypothetical protein M3395_10655, partial [Chloroflexota bacterium]|nr:hypothetical protein [Chloroflexota bacterium]
LFVLAHGVSMVISFRLRSQRDRDRVAELLEVSGMSIRLMYWGLIILLVAGIVAGSMGGHWGRGWIWAALGTLAVVMVIMYAVATPYYGRMRAATGIARYKEAAAKYRPPATERDLDDLATSTDRSCWRLLVASAWSSSSG